MQSAEVRKVGAIQRIVELLHQTAQTQGVGLPAETESLFDAGVLDSFGMLEFLTVIEEEVDIKIPDEDLVPANFETIAKIRAYISTRLGE